MLRAGIIGFGKMGILHGALVNGSNVAEVVAICDKSKVMKFGIKRVYPKAKVFSDVDEMLSSSNLDIVIISTPTFNHFESATKSLRSGCHVFIEKPLALSYEEAQAIAEEAKKSNRIVQVGFCDRFAPSIRKAKSFVEQGKVGDIERVVANIYAADVFEAHTGWRYNKKLSGGGVLIDFGIHMVDWLCWYFGAVKKVTAQQKMIYSKEVEDEVSAKFWFENGITADYECSWSKEGYRKAYHRMEIYGTKGKMVVTDQTIDIFDSSDNKVEDYVYPDLYDGAFMDVGGLLFSKQMEAFLDAVNTSTQSNLDSSVYVQKVVERLYESAEKECEITVD